MNTKAIREIGILLIVLIPFIYLGMVYSQLPDQVPTHFNLSGEPDRYSDRATLVWIILGLNIFIYILFLIIPKISPTKFEKINDKIYYRLRFGITFIMAAISALIIYMANGDAAIGIQILAVIFAVLCMFIGNYMQAVKSNYFIGIRTPWTLSNEEVWRKTHYVSGRLFFYGGLISLPLLFLVPSNLAPIPPVSVLVGTAIFSMIYSYIIFKKVKTEKS